MSELTISFPEELIDAIVERVRNHPGSDFAGAADHVAVPDDRGGGRLPPL